MPARSPSTSKRVLAFMRLVGIDVIRWDVTTASVLRWRAQTYWASVCLATVDGAERTGIPERTPCMRIGVLRNVLIYNSHNKTNCLCENNPNVCVCAVTGACTRARSRLCVLSVGTRPRSQAIYDDTC